MAEWWADSHWRARTVARCARAWRETSLERVARERRVLAEKAAELAALARAREQAPRAVARRAWRAMEAADERAGRSSLSPCPSALAPTPTRSRTALTFELAASLELAAGRAPGSGDAFGSPTTTTTTTAMAAGHRNGTNPNPHPHPPPSPSRRLNIAAIEREHGAQERRGDGIASRRGPVGRSRLDAKPRRRGAQRVEGGDAARRTAVASAAGGGGCRFARRRRRPCLSRWARWAATHRRDRIVTETYAARNRRRTKSRLLSGGATRWRAVRACARAWLCVGAVSPKGFAPGVYAVESVRGGGANERGGGGDTMVPRVRRVDAAAVASFRRRHATRAGVARVGGFGLEAQGAEPLARQLGTLRGRPIAAGEGRRPGRPRGWRGSRRRPSPSGVAAPRTSPPRTSSSTGVPAVAARRRPPLPHPRRRGEKSPGASRRRGSGRRRRTRRQSGSRRGKTRSRWRSPSTARDGRHARVCPQRPTQADDAALELILPSRGTSRRIDSTS